MTVAVLIGTTKGAFVMRDDGKRGDWTITGPHCDGWPINHVVGDPHSGQIWAAGGNGWNGAGVWRSQDGGQTWALSKLSNGDMDRWIKSDPEAARIFGVTEVEDAPFTGDLEALWSISSAHGRLYAGGKPGMLFSSDDDGKSWQGVEGINAHAERENWQGGGAGLTLHTILRDDKDPAKLWIGISAAGIFASEDGGATWETRNRRSNEDAAAFHIHAHEDGLTHGSDTEIGSCVHNMIHAGDNLIYQQNHHGTYRSTDGGRSWSAITEGLPSTFGFPIAVHPHDPATIWVVPMNGDMQGRYPPDACAKVWKSTNSGETWTAMTDGLPAQNCFFTVLRQAMAVDQMDTPGVYFGTNSGSIFASFDGGQSWSEPARHLPTVLSVETLTY